MKTAKLLLSAILILLYGSVSAQLFSIKSDEQVDGKPKYTLNLGGWIKINGIYDFVGVPNESALNLPSIPVGDVTKIPYFSMDMYQTRIKLESLYQSQKLGTIRAYIETDFYGSGGGNLRLRHAYVDIGDFRLGQAWTVLSDDDVWPDVIDFDGPVTGVWVRHVQLSWGKEYDNNTSFRLALESPFTNYDRFIDLDPSVASTCQNIPDIIARYRAGWKTGHVQIGGIFRSLNYEENILGDNNNVIDVNRESTEAWGFVLSSSFFKTARRMIQLQAAYGEGISSYMVGFQGAGFDAAPDGRGGVKSLPSYGGYIAGTYFWDQALRWSTTGVFGYTLIRNDEIDTFEGQRVGDIFEGEYYAINLFYRLTNNFRVGLEYDYGTHEDAQFQKGDAGRIQFDLEYAF